MAGGGGEKVEARTHREVEAESRKHTMELLRSASLLPCDPEEQQTTRHNPCEMEMDRWESRKHRDQLIRFALLPCDPEEQQTTVRNPCETEIEGWVSWKPMEQLLRFVLLRCDPEEQHTTRQTPREMGMKGWEFWEYMYQLLSSAINCDPGGFMQWYEPLTFKQRRTVYRKLQRVDMIWEMSCLKSFLEEHVTRLETQDLSKDMANKLNILDGGGGDEEEVDMDRGKSAIEEQLPSIISRLTPLETKAEPVMVLDTKKEMEGESGNLMEQQQSEALSCGPAVQIHDGADKDKEDVEMGRAKSLDMVMEVEYQKQLQSELEMVKQLLSEFPSLIESVKAVIESTKFPVDLLRWAALKRSAHRFLESRGYTALCPIFTLGDYVSNLNSVLPRKVPRKIKRESFSSREQQPRTQDTELKSGPTAEDPILGFLLDMPFASAVDDDDNELDIINKGKSAEQIANEEEMACEQKEFASYRRDWEFNWGQTYGYFEDMTAISPMHFTHLTPGCRLDTGADFERTLQIFTIKLAEIKGGIKWPLLVYGVIAARDDVDHNRNLLFSCSRMEAQKLDQDDPYLRLIGPSRAILFTDHAKFEVQLRVKGATVSQDSALISAVCDYTDGCYPGVLTTCFKNCFCTIELCLEQIQQTVQATVLSVRVKNGPWPFSYGAEVSCSAPSHNSAPSSMNVVLLASRGRPMPKGSDGLLHLSRNVVSVGLEGSLSFFVHAYSQSGEIAAQGQVCFIPRKSNITQQTCFFGDPKVEVEVTVAWSALVSDKLSITREGEEMACEQKEFASYRTDWEFNWGRTYGYFEDMTAISPMHFTHLTPGCRLDTGADFERTLQIFTIKLVEIKGGIEWPLFVYGVIAARDDVDHNRNLLFSCSRMEAQKLDQDDPYLRLIGPSRAILFTDHAKFEVQLRVKGTTVSQDSALISAVCDYTDGYYPGVLTTCFKNCFCTIELCLERIQQTVQATVLSVRVKNGMWPFSYGGEVSCSAPSHNSAPSSMNVVLLASRGRPMPKGSDGHLLLSRNVVSVGLEGSLSFFVHAYSQSGEIAAQGQVCFIPRQSNITQQTCFFGDPKVEVEITVAWSALVSDKQSITREGWMFETSNENGWQPDVS